MTRPRVKTLVLAAVVALVAALSACAGQAQRGSVTVLGPWTGAEGEQFRDVLGKFTEKTGITVEYQDARGVSQVLRANVQAGTPPDVAILASPGELASYIRAGNMRPLNDVIDERDRAVFRPLWLLPQDDGRVYTVPVKANLKNLIWFNSGQTRATPRTWEELTAHTQSIAAGGSTPWCMGMGDAPNSGWPGTDMIEDMLLRQSGADAYQRWASGELGWGQDGVVEQAWRTWGAIATDPRMVRGGRGTALLTDFVDSARPMFADPPGCYLESQASFMMGFYRGFEDSPLPREDFDFLALAGPGRQDEDRAWTASADLAGMFNETEESKELLRFLATDAQVEWPKIKGSSAFTVSAEVEPDIHDDPVSRRIAQILRSAETLCFDAADVMPSAMRNAFYRAVLEYLNDPGRLDAVLAGLDRVRTGIEDEDWLHLPCDR